MKRNLSIIFCACLIVVTPNIGSSRSQELAVLEKVKILETGDYVRTIIYLSETVPYSVDDIPQEGTDFSYSRIYIDFESTNINDGVSRIMDVDYGTVKQVRIGHLNPTTARVVIDIEDQQLLGDDYEVTSGTKPYRIIVDVKGRRQIIGELSGEEGNKQNGQVKNGEEKPEREKDEEGDENQGSRTGDKVSPEEIKLEQRLLLETDLENRPGELVEIPLRVKPYRFDIGLFGKYNNNTFQATAGAPKEEVFTTSPSIKFDYGLVREKESTLTARLRFQYNIVSGIDDANFYELDGALNYTWGPNSVEVRSFNNIDKVAFISNGKNVESNSYGVRSTYSRVINKRTSFKLQYEFAYQNFKNSPGRDNFFNEISGDVRYRFKSYFRPGIGFEIGRRDADSSNQERNEFAPVFLVISSINKRVWSRFRYRYRIRDYTTDNREDDNFSREDRRHDLREDLNIRLHRKWWLSLFASYINNDSTREGRDFDSFEIGAGIFYRFP